MSRPKVHATGRRRGRRWVRRRKEDRGWSSRRTRAPRWGHESQMTRRVTGHARPGSSDWRSSGEDPAQQLLADEHPDLLAVVHVPATGRADEREHEAGDVLGGLLEVDAGTDPAGPLLPFEVRQQERGGEVED